MRELGAERFVEVGPGKVLTGLVKRTLRDVELAHA
jgi:malonyl CoA-acyl carrier protein transacylase